jgi:DNA-binding response OmpR family regulator
LIGDLADVSVAATMAQARHALESAQWSLVILDIELPDGSGVDLISLLKYEESTPTPVIIFTADEVGNDIARKVEHALVKSRTSNEDLLATISAMISKPGDKIP